MASSTQIVPMWTFPHVQSYVNDYTYVETETAVANPLDYPNYLCVFTSGKGVDNQFVTRTTVADARDTYGRRDFATYGQPYSQALSILESANGRIYMHCMRVLPEDATFANSYARCYYKADVANKTFKIFWTTKNLEADDAPASIDEFREHLADEPDEITDYTGLTIFGVRSLGRGKYGNNYRWRITTDRSYEKEYKIKFQKVQFLSGENGLSSIYTGTGTSMYSIKTGTTTFFNDLFDNLATNGDVPAVLEVNEDNYHALFAAYTEFLTAVQEANPTETIVIPDEDCFDPFFGMSVATEVADPYVVIMPKAYTAEEQADLLAQDPSFVYNADDYAPDGVEAINMSDLQGMYLKGGSEGAFDETDPVKRQEAVDAAYIAAFSGVYDKRILSARRIYASALFDANYSFPVKQALAALAKVRNDAVCYLDTGIISSYNAANVQNLISDYRQFDVGDIMDTSTSVPCISKNLHHYTIRDPETGRKNVVTFVYYLATIFYNHYMQYGVHVPMANTRAQLSGHVSESLEPTVEDYENELRELFTENRFNWCEAVAPNQFRRVCQLISQDPDSDMIEESNVHVLFQLKREVEAECRDIIYDFTSTLSRRQFTQYLTAKYNDWNGRVVESVSFDFSQNTWEGERSIVHGYINVVFRGLQKRFILEFDINRRSYDEE